MTHPDDAAEHLDHYLDRLAGRPGLSNGHRTEEALAAAAILALVAGDTGADPRPGFLANLEDQLEMNAPSISLPRQIATTTSIRRATRPDHLPPAIPGSPLAKWLATAALTIVVALVASLAFGGNDPHNPRSDSFGFIAGTPPAVSPLDVETVDVAECAMQARPEGTVLGLVGQTPSRARMLPDFYHYPLPATPTPRSLSFGDAQSLLSGLPQADETVSNGLTSTMRQATACRFYSDLFSTAGIAEQESLGLDNRFFAIYSDDFFRQGAFVADGYFGESTYVNVSWVPIGPAAWVIEDARMLSDGRALALFRPSASTDHSSLSYAAVFIQADDYWLIDEMVQVDPQTRPTTIRTWPQVLEIALRRPEEGQSTGSTVRSFPSAEVTFYAHQPVTVTVANFGPVPQEFHIDALGIVIEVDAGHSVSLALTAPTGAYVMGAYFTSNDGTIGQEIRGFEAILRFVDEGTPISLG